MTTPPRARVRAPELRGRAWLNTGGKAYSISDFRGSLLLLDFWTFCCINCLHVLDELRPIEDEFDDVLTVVGVHSPKFEHEADHDALVAAVERYGVQHPVLDDPDLVTWQNYAVRAWPTLTLIDPEGYVVGQYSGEGHGHALAATIRQLVAAHERQGTLRRGDSPYVPPRPEPTTLRFPGKALPLPAGTFLVSDTGHHSLVELGADLETVVRRIGSGERGLTDGDGASARFSEPQGVAHLPAAIAEAVGYDVVVADTVNHVLRGLRFDDGRLTTVAGTGRPWMQGDPTGAELAGDALATPMSSPWDVLWSDEAGGVVVAMAGIHQIWSFDPVRRTVRALAGTTNEGLLDGDLQKAWFAQPSGLTEGTDGRVWVADAETSAVRSITFAGPDHGLVETSVGTGLFDFGFRDGPAAEARLQHPLAVTGLPDGSIAICDTYNDAVRRLDVRTGEVTTLATGLREPSGAVVDGETLVVVESAAHRLTRLALGVSAVPAADTIHRTLRPVLDVAAGAIELRVVFRPPPGQKLDEREGPATRLLVTSTPESLLAAGTGRDVALSRTLRLAEGADEGVIHVAAMAASCDDGGTNPACHIHQQDWGVPVRVVDGGAHRLELILAG